MNNASEKSLSAKIGEGLFFFASNTVILKLIGLLSIFLILRRLTVYEYGVSELVFSVVAIMNFFLLPGMADLLLAEIGREKGAGDLARIKKLFSDYAKLAIGLGVVFWLVLFWGADIISDYYGKNIANLFRIASFLFLISGFRALMTLLFNVYLKFFASSLKSFLEEFSKLCFLALFFFYFNLRMEGIFLAQVLSQIAAFIILLPSAVKLYKTLSMVTPAEDISLKQIFLGHGKWAALINYLSILGNNMRLWLIKFFLGTEMVGLFAVAYGLFSHTSALFPLSSVVRPIIPQYFEIKEKFYKLIEKSIKYQFLGYLFIGIIAFFLFPAVIVRLFPNYASSMFLFRGMLFALIPVSFAAIFTQTFYAIRAQKSFFLVLLVRTVSIAAFLPIFAYFFGPAGIIYEFLLTSLIFALERYRVLRKLMPDFQLSLRDFFSIDDMDRYFIKRIKDFIKSKIKYQNAK
jgi:O-antigen/teichoic acid export membrane protein